MSRFPPFRHINISTVKVPCSNQLDRDCALAEPGLSVFEFFCFKK